MIDEIEVKNLALISRASFQPCEGLTVLTGETGAGKSALLGALKLLMGERADKQLVREGASELYVAGRFVGITIPAEESEAAGDEPADEVVAVRRVNADGRSRVTLNGEMAGVSELAASIGPTIDLCSQHENQQLLKVTSHVELLDAWAGRPVAEALQAYREAFGAAGKARSALRALEEAGQAGEARLEEARFTLRRIEAVRPQEGEYEELLADLQRAEHAEALATAANTAYGALAGEDGGFDQGACDLVDDALAALDGALRLDASLGDMVNTLRDAQTMLEDVSASARAYRDTLDFDADALAQKQERAAALQGLLRAYGPRMQDVFAAWDAARDAVSAVDDADVRLAEARAAVDAAEARLAEAEQALRTLREQAAPAFSAQVSEQMRFLEMGSAEVICKVDELPRERWNATGGQAVEFLFRSGAGLAPRPLAKIASGGEISRVMLAMKVVLGENDTVQTLVFDEVDAGVGGTTALALAAVLERLAQSHQVIVVTHLAQVAAKASRHYVVRKSAGDVPETTLSEVEGEARVEEIARMLGGTLTDTSRAHARELLGSASR